MGQVLAGFGALDDFGAGRLWGGWVGEEVEAADGHLQIQQFVGFAALVDVYETARSLISPPELALQPWQPLPVAGELLCLNQSPPDLDDVPTTRLPKVRITSACSASLT